MRMLVRRTLETGGNSPTFVGMSLALPRRLPGQAAGLVEESAGGPVVVERGQVHHDPGALLGRTGAGLVVEVRGDIAGSGRIDLDVAVSGIATEGLRVLDGQHVHRGLGRRV